MITQKHTTSQVNKEKIDKIDFSFCDWSFSVKVTKIFALLFNASKHFPLVFYSHHRIAFLSGMSISSVRRALDELRSEGFVSWHKRWGYNQTNNYKISPDLFDPEREKKLLSIFRIMFAVSLSFLLSKERTAANERLLNKRLDLYKCLVKERVSYQDRDEADPPVDHFLFQKKRRWESRKTMIDTKDRQTIIDKISEKHPLTIHGKLKLCIYPPDALRIALTKIPYAQTKDTPYRVLLWVAEEYCKKNGLIVHREVYEMRCKELGISALQNNTSYREELFAHILENKSKEYTSAKKYSLPEWVMNDRFTPEQLELEKKEVLATLSALPTRNYFQQLLHDNFSRSLD